MITYFISGDLIENLVIAYVVGSSELVCGVLKRNLDWIKISIAIHYQLIISITVFTSPSKYFFKRRCLKFPNWLGNFTGTIDKREALK